MDDDVLAVRAQRVWNEEPGDELVARGRSQGTFEGSSPCATTSTGTVSAPTAAAGCSPSGCRCVR